MNTILIGGVAYTQAELMAILETPVRGSARINLLHQLIAATLNYLNGATQCPQVSQAISDANAELGKPYPDDAYMLELKDILDDYNNGALEGCHAEHCG